MAKRKCRHCDLRVANCARQLCYPCYTTAEIKCLYPPKPTGSNQHCELRDEPTMEELDRMIAEQLPTMPRERGANGVKPRVEHWTPPLVKVMRMRHRQHLRQS